MSASEQGKELTALLKKLRAQRTDAANAAPFVPVIDQSEPTLSHLLSSFLLWESTTPKAAQALKKVDAAFVDFNELRICLPDELGHIIGDRYPRAGERCLRLRSVLSAVYAREHRVSLEHLPTLSKRDARAYLESLEGMPGFVAARVCLLVLGQHAAPVDSRILRRLVEAGVVKDGTGVDEASGILERRLRAGEMPEVYGLLQSWADEASYAATESHLDAMRPKHVPVNKAKVLAEKAAAKAERSRARPPKRKSTKAKFTRLKPKRRSSKG